MTWIKTEKAVGPLGLVSEIVKSTVQAGFLLVTVILPSATEKEAPQGNILEFFSPRYS